MSKQINYEQFALLSTNREELISIVFEKILKNTISLTENTSNLFGNTFENKNFIPNKNIKDLIESIKTIIHTNENIDLPGYNELLSENLFNKFVSALSFPETFTHGINSLYFIKNKKEILKTYHAISPKLNELMLNFINNESIYSEEYLKLKNFNTLSFTDYEKLHLISSNFNLKYSQKYISFINKICEIFEKNLNLPILDKENFINQHATIFETLIKKAKELKENNSFSHKYYNNRAFLNNLISASFYAYLLFYSIATVLLTVAPEAFVILLYVGIALVASVAVVELTYAAYQGISHLASKNKLNEQINFALKENLNIQVGLISAGIAEANEVYNALSKVTNLMQTPEYKASFKHNLSKHKSEITQKLANKYNLYQHTLKNEFNKIEKFIQEKYCLSPEIIKEKLFNIINVNGVNVFKSNKDSRNFSTNDFKKLRMLSELVDKTINAAKIVMIQSLPKDLISNNLTSHFRKQFTEKYLGSKYLCAGNSR